MASNLTKTEQLILGRLASSHNGKWSYSHGYRTGRKGSYGSRMVDAACKLRDKGLVRLTVIGSFMDCRSAYTDHWTEILVEMAK